VISLVAISGLALAIRLAYSLAVADDLALAGDAQTYHLLADRLAAGDGYVRTQGVTAGEASAEFPPLFPAVLSVVDVLGGDSVRVQRVFTSVVGAGTVALIGLVGRRVRGPAVGVVAAGLAALYPMLFQADGALLAESLYALLVSAVLLATYRAIDSRAWVDWVVAGVLVGLAALTRTEGILLLPVVLVPEAVRWAGDAWRARWAAVGLTVAASIVVIGPWIARNYVTFDRFVPISNNSGTLIAGANCDRAYEGQYLGIWRFECVTSIDVTGLDEAETADRFREVGVDYAREHASEVPKVVTVRVLRTFGLYEPKDQIDWESFEGRTTRWQTIGHRMFLVLVPLAIAGAVVLARARRSWWPLVAPVAIVAFTSAISYGNQRFRILAEPGVLVLAAISMVALARGIAGRLRGRRAPA
jgi:4-amino-4-deoxy-L-arabinose transferase-like glycosyltransferase